jgi:putative aldouronate transport system substrate-binding protein
MYGLPPTFRDEGGELVHRFETPEFKEALEFLTKVIEQGSMHPDAVAGTGNGKDRFEAGQTVFMNDGVGAWHEGLTRVRPGNPDFDPMALDFFAPDGGAPTLYRGHPVNIFSFLKNTDDEERIKEALRIADFCAAQFGTVEKNLLSYGEEGVHHTLDADGVPQLTEQGTQEVTSTFEFLAQPAIVNAKVQFPEYVKDSSEWMARQSEFVEDPLFFGIQIQEPAQFGSLGQPIDDLVVDISRGRASIDEFDAAVETWRSDGGDELREFYAEFLD